MDISRILEELDAPEGDVIPTEALRAATALRAELVPVLLREIEACTAAGVAGYPRQQLVFFAIHLLGEWQESRAYRPLAALLRSPPEPLGVLLGDAVTETIHRVMAQVFDGDFQPLRGIILDPDTDEFIRWMMFEALTVLFAQDKLSMPDILAFLLDCYDHMQPRAQNLAWSGWGDAIAKLGLAELRPQVTQVMRQGWIGEDDVTAITFETLIAAHIKGGPRECILDAFKPFADAAAELGRWRMLDGMVGPDNPRNLDEDMSPTDRSIGARTHVNEFPAPGRNDPCPCGSGKKYKNCHLLLRPPPGTLVN